MTLQSTVRVGGVLNYGVADPSVDAQTGLRIPPVFAHVQAGVAITAGDVVRLRPNVGGTGTPPVAGQDYILDVGLLELTFSGDEVSGHGFRGVATHDAAQGDQVEIQLQGVCMAAVGATVVVNAPLSHQADGVFNEAGDAQAVYGYSLAARTGAGLVLCLVFPTPIGITDASFAD